MSPSERQEFEDMKRELQTLRREMNERKQQQLQIPIDEATLGALNQALYNRQLDRLTVKDLRYKTLTAI